MRKSIDITNNRYGRLVAVQRVANDKNNHELWLCKCDCGNESIVLKNSLTSNRTRSCGCYYKESRLNASKKHGMTHSRLYAVWANMIRRCNNPKANDWKFYGAKGVTVCDEWKHFSGFYEWAKKTGYKDDLTIDRIDNNGNYCPDNCRWANWDIQMNNTTRNHYIEVNGVVKTAIQWCREKGISPSTFYYRINKGWTDVDAIVTPLRKARPV